MPKPLIDRTFLCVDCRADTALCEYYMLKDRLWRRIMGNRDGMLCIGCVEERIGRLLIKTDFLPCPLNKERMWTRSWRLRNRLRRLAQ